MDGWIRLALLLSKEPQMLVFCSPTSYCFCASKSPPTTKLALFPHHQHNEPEVVKVKVHSREQTVGDNAAAKRSLNVINWKIELDFCQAGMLWVYFTLRSSIITFFFLQRCNWLDWKDVQTFYRFRLPKCPSEKRRRNSVFKKYNSRKIELRVVSNCAAQS